MSTPFYPGDPSSGICMKCIKTLVQGADVHFSYLFTNRSFECFENSLFFKVYAVVEQIINVTGRTN